MEHLQLEDFHPNNRRILLERQDPNFSAQRNYAIIQETIDDYEKMQVRADAKLAEKAGIAADMLAGYAQHRLVGSGTKSMEDYLGKDLIKRVYGEKLMSKIKVMDSIRRLNQSKGNNLYGGNFYLPGRD